MMFSALRDRKWRFSLVWKAWIVRCVRISSDGTLSYYRPSDAKMDPTNEKCPRHKKFLLDTIEVSLITHEQSDSSNEKVEFGLVVKCQTLDRVESYFRCILPEEELKPFLDALKSVAKQHNIDNIPRNELSLYKEQQRVFIMRSRQSVMRRAVTMAMDRYDERSKHDRIVGKRGAFIYLPVFLSNDLIHGSWWFAWGSIMWVVTCAVVIDNRDAHFLGDDDSILSHDIYEASWYMMLIAALFSSLGSLAFVRAFHEDPPLPPLFTWYHLQSDELLASWLFVGMTMPFVPYFGLFLTAGDEGILYFCGLLFSILGTICCLIFVRACYPTDKAVQHKDILLPLSRYFMPCSSQATREHYFINDWLGGSWIFFWGSLILAFGTFINMLVALSESSPLHIWTDTTFFLESLMFLVGSAYFVAGSYPDKSVFTKNMSDEEREYLEEEGSDHLSSKPSSSGEKEGKTKAPHLFMKKSEAALNTYKELHDEDEGDAI